MGSNPRPPVIRRAARALVAALLSAVVGSQSVSCATDAIARFPVREPLWTDPDMAPFTEMPARRDASGSGQMAEQTVLRPVARALTLPLPTESWNVNSLDEVPNSSWFTNRIGRFPVTPDEIARGACGDAPPLDPTHGPWLVTSGKPDGSSRGFVVKAPDGRRYLIKFDGPLKSERATAADVVGSKIFFAAGYNTPCNQIVFFSEDILRIDPAAKRKDSRTGQELSLTRADLDGILAVGLRRRDGLIRASASQYLPGTRLGPFRYEGTRADDPNDVIPHERRRELRASMLLSAWIHHWDGNENNTLDMMIDRPGGRFVRHNLLDWSDCFGDIWAWSWERLDARIGLGRSGYLDLGSVMVDLVSLGLYPRPWYHVPRPPRPESFGYFGTEAFVPSKWHGTYSNPAFAEMTMRDAAWAVRIIARFRDEHIAALVDTARMDDLADRDFLIDTLRKRRDVILREYLTQVSPLDAFTLTRAGPGRPQTLCFTDLAIATGVTAAASTLYQLHLHTGVRLETLLGWRKIRPGGDRPAETCTELPFGPLRPHTLAGSAAAEDDPRRYAVLEIYNNIQSARRPTASVLLHLVDLGPERGFRIVGIERPDAVKDNP